MSLFSDNIRYLRTQRRISQESFAESLKIKRTRYVKYEDGSTEAPYEILLRISHFFHISIDLLLSADIRKVNVEEMLKLEDNRILLPIMHDKQGRNVIEVVPLKAKAGYIRGFGDPVFIQDLPQIALPFLGAGKHRAFPIDGDSMPPHEDTSLIVGKYIENLGDIRKDKTYIFVLTDDIVYKRLDEKKGKSLIVKSDNNFYEPYPIKLSDILEIWEFACSLNTKEASLLKVEPQPIEHFMNDIRNELKAIKTRLDS